jgi:hypothetical protein
LRTLALLEQVAPAPGAPAFREWRELARLGPPDPRRSGPLGFDGMRLLIRREDEEVRWDVGVLLDTSAGRPTAVALLVECQPADPRRPWEVRELRERWPHASEDSGAGWRARWRDPRRAAELEARARTLLGGHYPARLHPSLADAYDLLLDPLRPIEYVPPGEDPCGPAEGRAALERLLRAGRDDLVRNVLRGLDPEGRLYACEALLGPLEPDDEDTRALARVLALDVEVHLRGGRRCKGREALGTLAREVALSTR